MELDAILNAEKLRNYEREYILPAFAFAEAIGFDLRQAVAGNPGNNCVALLVEHLALKAGYLGFQYNLRAAQGIAKSSVQQQAGQNAPTYLCPECKEQWELAHFAPSVPTI